jgi:seryl-tRNA synthetase
MTNPPETYSRESGPPDQTALPPEGANTELESEILALKTTNKDLIESLNKANYEKDELVLKLNRANQERDDLLRQKQVNQLKIRKLNDMIIKNSSKSDEPIDEDILQDMFRIRNLTTEIIKTHFAGEAKFHPDKARRLEDYYAHFYDQRVRKNVPEGRRRLLISAVFEELQHLFFGPNAKRFGVPRDMEKELQQFERQIETSNKGS